jgi:nucleoside-diphosphate-sugar epimerase
VRIVLTGCGGRIGRAIRARLAGEHEVIGIDRVTAADVELVGDVCDRALLERACDGAGAVIHVAALHAPHVGVFSDEEFERINVAGTAAVVAAARATRVPRIVFTSTTALYQRSGFVDEETEPHPKTIYHRTKLAAESLLRSEAERGGLDVRIIRMSRCFPEPANLMAAYRLYRGVDARDVADAHARALFFDGPAHAMWVVSGATPFTRADALSLSVDAAPLLRERAPSLVAAYASRGWPLPKTIDRIYSSERAERELGWHPRYGFEEVLKQLDAGSTEVLFSSSKKNNQS